MAVTETFFSIEVSDMRRATEFYASALGATVSFASPTWTSLHVAGVRLGLFHHPRQVRGKLGLHFAVDDLLATCADVERGGGRILGNHIEVAPGVVTVEVADTEGNVFTLRRSS